MIRPAALLVSFLIVPLAPAIEARAQVNPSGPSAATVQNTTEARRYYQRGLAEAGKGKDATAISDFERSIALDPNAFATYKALDDVLSKDRQWATDIQYWSQYIQLHPNDARAYCEQGGSYSWLHDTAHAIADADKACTLGDQSCCQIASNFRAHQAAGTPPARLNPSTSRRCWGLVWSCCRFWRRSPSPWAPTSSRRGGKAKRHSRNLCRLRRRGRRRRNSHPLPLDRCA